MTGGRRPAAAEFRRVSVADLPALLDLQAAYYREDGYPFDASAARAAWTALLADEGLGAAWTAVAGDDVVGYLVVTFGFSLEYRGRDAFIDELYVTPGWRGAGLGRQAMTIADAACRASGVRALHLEVEPDKPRAAALYASHGFADRGRRLMTKRFQ